MVKDVAVTDAAGERNYKLVGATVSVSQNGNSVNASVLDRQTLYASPLITITDKGYTKHYFEEGNRICSSIGGGRLGLVDEAEPIVLPWDEWQTALRQGVLETYKQSFGVEPYIGVGDLYVSIDRFSNEENTDEPTFYYHTDHLGSATLITDDYAQIAEQIAYLPYGEDWIDMRHYFGSAYKFNGKEKDDETGYSYYGARYYTDRLSIWLSVDPLADKYPHLSPYAYCADNPVMRIDPDGRADTESYTDLYNMSGKKIGTDGIDNGVKMVVTDKKEARLISKIKGDVDLNNIQSGVILPSDATLQESLNVLDRTVINGGLREESSIVMNDGTVIQGQTDSMPTIINGLQRANTSLPNLPAGTTPTDVEATIHSHPTTVQQLGNMIYPQEATLPSTTDRATFSQFNINIIVGPLGPVNLSNVTTNPNGTFNVPNRPNGAVLYDRNTNVILKLNRSAIQNILKK